jgi:hypothetical protein
MPPDKDVVLIAHSASGYFLPLVAERRPLRRLVFLASSIPQLGMSFLDQFRVDPSIVWPDWVGKDTNPGANICIWSLGHRVAGTGAGSRLKAVSVLGSVS